MIYKKMYKNTEESKVISKEEARQSLDGHWSDEMLNDIFTNGKEFRLFTPWAIIWTETEEGMIPVPEFYGVKETGMWELMYNFLVKRPRGLPCRVHQAMETFKGTDTELYEYTKHLQKKGCYNISIEKI